MRRLILIATVLLAPLALAKDGDKTTDKRAGLDWWSLQPLSEAPPPGVPRHGKNAIDGFVFESLKTAKLKPSGEAEKRILIRRLSYDLLGLPPTPEDVDAFVNDRSADAYEKLVDRLLASPHHGERWGRHWLDVVRFGESHGFEYNQPRNNAWPYRNWVIEALNADMPYNRFVALQLAGDILEPDNGGTVAVACLVTGPHNTTKPSNDVMRKTMRQDELEDMVGMVNQTFLGLTTNCARCHDHKFDPISIQDYYSMVANLAGVEFGEREAHVGKGSAAKVAAANSAITKLRDELRAMDRKARDAAAAALKTGATAKPGPTPFAAWNFDESLQDQAGDMHVELLTGATRDSNGLVLDGKKAWAKSKPLTQPLAAKTLEAWVRVADANFRSGGVICLQTTNGNTFDAIVYAEREPKRWMAGSNGFGRYKPFGAPEETDFNELVHVAITYAEDGTVTGYRNGLPYGKPYKTGFQKYEAGKTEVIFGLRHGKSAGGGRMFKGSVARARLYDRALTAEEVAASARANGLVITETHIVAQLSTEQRRQRQTSKREIQRLQSEVASLKPGKVWTVKPIRAAEVKVLARGDVRKEKEVVPPRGLPALKTLNADFGLAPNAPDKERRRKLAEWTTDSKNPLFSRVIVNRLWHYHFGRGIVATPNDLGFSGAKPSHPQLLDWLAKELQTNNWSLKHMHRLMVTSATYRQSSEMSDKAAAVDAGNLLLWRMSPKRIEGEALRDSMLMIAGKLDPTLGGKGYRDMREYRFKGSHFYDPIPQDKPEQFRRTVYRFAPRGAKRTMLDTFDCPDPSALTPNRAETTTPLQSLALMNNDFVLLMAQSFAERLEEEAGGNVADQLQLACQLAYGRDVERGELKTAEPFIEKHGLAAYCRVMFNSNELLYVR
jgi:hypothetical protein